MHTQFQKGQSGNPDGRRKGQRNVHTVVDEALGVAPEIAVKTLTAPAAPQLDLGDSRYTWKPWRDVAPPHFDVMSARFVEAEFAADLSTVAREEGADTYRDPREFFVGDISALPPRADLVGAYGASR